MPNITELENLVVQVRRDILRQVHKVNSGHPGGSLGCAEFFVALFQEIMRRKDGFDMDGHGEDLFFCQTAISPLFFTAFWPDQDIFQWMSSIRLDCSIQDYKVTRPLTKVFPVFAYPRDP